jgi:hypothetical protein
VRGRSLIGLNRQIADFNRTFPSLDGRQDAHHNLEVALGNANLFNWGLKTPSKFDIFKRLRNRTSIWIVAVEGLEEARNQINRLAIVGPADYLTDSAEKGLVVERVIR